MLFVNQYAIFFHAYTIRINQIGALAVFDDFSTFN